MPDRIDDDEGPSDDDIARFGGDEDAGRGAAEDDPMRHRRDRLGFCPQCGAEVYEDADLCPACFAWITGEVVRRHPAASAIGKRALVAIGLLLAGVLTYLALRGAF